MTRAVIIVRTANRPEVLKRCLSAIIQGCEIGRDAHWLVLDDSSPNLWAVTCEVLQFWKRQGVMVGYANESTEDEIVTSLQRSGFSSFFRHLVPKSPACRSERGRNLGLLAGLSLSPDLLFFVDDDVVHRHDDKCFFHWCANNAGSGNSVAAPRKLGIGDMSYLNRLVGILDRDDWGQFISEQGLSSVPELWYSRDNPFWKPADGEAAQAEAVSSREVVSGQLMALRNSQEEWLPFPGGYNEDLNWSLMQSACMGTPLLKVRGADVYHLPPCLPHPSAESIFLELVGTAITRAIRQIQPRGDQTMATLTLRLPEALASELKRDVFLFLNVKRAILSCLRSSKGEADAVRIVSKIGDALSAVAERLKSIDCREAATAWLDDFGTRRRMFRELRRSEPVQYHIRRALFGEVLPS